MAHGVDEEGVQGDEQEPPEEAVALEPAEAGVNGDGAVATLEAARALEVGPAGVAVAVVGLAGCEGLAVAGAVGHSIPPPPASGSIPPLGFGQSPYPPWPSPGGPRPARWPSWAACMVFFLNRRTATLGMVGRNPDLPTVEYSHSLSAEIREYTHLPLRGHAEHAGDLERQTTRVKSSKFSGLGPPSF
jgi:hypothetical protein